MGNLQGKQKERNCPLSSKHVRWLLLALTIAVCAAVVVSGAVTAGMPKSNSTDLEPVNTAATVDVQTGTSTSATLHDQLRVFVEVHRDGESVPLHRSKHVDDQVCIVGSNHQYFFMYLGPVHDQSTLTRAPLFRCVRPTERQATSGTPPTGLCLSFSCHRKSESLEIWFIEELSSR